MLAQSHSATTEIRRVRGRTRRTQSLGTKLTQLEESTVLKAAERDGKVPSEWARDTLLAGARRGNSDDKALFIEVQALRLLLINALETLLRGDRMTPEQFKAMLQYVKLNKRKAAADVLTGYAEEGLE